ncbi:hypothetical protein [Streptococcus sp. A22]|uniref:hypothetical protein n=1 Tax=Streptococcus sp. A22 TaxID=3373126 RepID=UPI001FD800E0
MTKRRIFISLVVAITILILGGCGMASQKETLTKEQQDNVVKRISRNYKIKKVEFVNLERNNSTGYYSLVFKVNDKKTTNIVQFKNAEEFDSSEGIIALDPIEEFTDIKKSIEFDSSKRVDTSDITIIYLKG